MNNDEAHEFLESAVEAALEAKVEEMKVLQANHEANKDLAHIPWEVYRDIVNSIEAMATAERFIDAGFVNMARAGFRRTQRRLLKVIKATELPPEIEPFDDLEVETGKFKSEEAGE